MSNTIEANQIERGEGRSSFPRSRRMQPGWRVVMARRWVIWKTVRQASGGGSRGGYGRKSGVGGAAGGRKRWGVQGVTKLPPPAPN